MAYILLPATLKELRERFSNENLRQYFLNRDFSSVTPKDAKVMDYCRNSLQKGRPLDTCMIFMAGQSGAGKSKTINVLFDDDEVCTTNDSKSATKDVTVYRKQLCVTKEHPEVVGYLAFVDGPGTFDTDREEAKNLAIIKKFRNNCRALWKRDLGWFSYLLGNATGMSIRQNVYPNLVLYVLKGGDLNRIGGTSSLFIKSFKALKASNIVDTKYPNLIIIVSHALSIAAKKDIYAKKRDHIVVQIENIVTRILGLPKVPIVFVENEPSHYDLKKVGDFYELPDGSLSHRNLIEIMCEKFTKDADVLSKLFGGWYFHPACPDKGLPFEILGSLEDITPNDTDLLEAEMSLMEIGIDAGSNLRHCGVFGIQALGYGYCPVSESIKAGTYLLESTCDNQVIPKRNVLALDGTKYLLPGCVEPSVETGMRIRKRTFPDRMQYVEERKRVYGIDAEWELCLDGAANGRWITEGTEYIVMTYLQEIKVATLKLEDVKSAVVNTTFLKALEALPLSYDSDLKPTFVSFFEDWGTHVVSQLAIGGCIRLECTVKNEALEIADVDRKVAQIFARCLGPNSDKDDLSGMDSPDGIQNVYLEIEGGFPLGLPSLENLNPSEIIAWTDTVHKAPLELTYTIKLVPYFSLLENGPEKDALMTATKDYMATSMVKPDVDDDAAKIMKKAMISEKAVSDAIAEASSSGLKGANTGKKGTKQGSGEDGNCFPEGTMVRLVGNSNEVPIQLLRPGHDLTTLRHRKGRTGDILQTKFCTFLHYDPNKMVGYIVLGLSNGTNLPISQGHLIFYIANGGRDAMAKPAGKIVEGDELLTIGPGPGNEAKFVAVLKIENKVRKGAYAPLSGTGTFVAEGVLVSCYSNVDSFDLAEAACLPLKWWGKWKDVVTSNKVSNNTEIGTNGIHPYAKFLQKVRDGVGLTSSKPSAFIK